MKGKKIRGKKLIKSCMKCCVRYMSFVKTRSSETFSILISMLTKFNQRSNQE